jgi:hypothetical protein
MMLTMEATKMALGTLKELADIMVLDIYGEKEA